jgi:hypothetical protein
MTKRLTMLLIGIGFLAGCAKEEPPPRTVTEFLDNPILLEAAMVRCSRDRNESRYDPECVNAREAVKRVQAREEEARRIELEARSENKRKALRRMQEAQEEARRRAEEAERLRREAEYLAQFGVLPPSDDGGGAEELPAGNVPIAVVPEAETEGVATPPPVDVEPSVVGSNAPTVEIVPPDEDED